MNMRSVHLFASDEKRTIQILRWVLTHYVILQVRFVIESLGYTMCEKYSSCDWKQAYQGGNVDWRPRRHLGLTSADVHPHQLLWTVQPVLADQRWAWRRHLHPFVVKLPEFLPLEKVSLLVVVLEDPINVIRHPFPHLNVARIVELYVLNFLIVAPVHIT